MLFRSTEYAYGAVAVSMGLGFTTITRGFHEIMVSGENLARGGRAVFGTVAHEATHAYNIQAGIRDVDTNGRHNKRFKESAEHLFGLTITKLSESIGWSKTDVSPECAKRWRDQIKAIDEAIATVARREEASGFGFGGGFTFGGLGHTQWRWTTLIQCADAFGWRLDDFQWITVNSVKSAFAHFEERLKIINEIVKPRYAELRAK